MCLGRNYVLLCAVAMFLFCRHVFVLRIRRFEQSDLIKIIGKDNEGRTAVLAVPCFLPSTGGQQEMDKALYAVHTNTLTNDAHTQT